MEGNANVAVRAPAICLMATAGLYIVVLLVGLLFDLSIVAVSLNPRSNVFQHAMTRIGFAILIGLANVHIIRGGWEMMRCGRYKAAKQSAILAMIPCIGPCFLLGIPFGAWAFAVLNREHVKNSFARQD